MDSGRHRHVDSRAAAWRTLRDGVYAWEHAYERTRAKLIAERRWTALRDSYIQELPRVLQRVRVGLLRRVGTFLVCRWSEMGTHKPSDMAQ